MLIFLCGVLASKISSITHRYNWLRLAFPVSGLNLIPMDQVRNDLLSRISRLRDPPEFGVAKVSRRKMDEVARTRSTKELRFLKRYVSSLNIFIWGIAVCCHAACKNFAGLFAVRFVLGICEGSITAGFMIVSSMFYTRREHTARVGYWCKDYDQPPLTPFSQLFTVLMNGTGLKAESFCSRRHSKTLQLKLSPVSSALAPCIFILLGFSRGNGKSKIYILPIHLPSLGL